MFNFKSWRWSRLTEPSALKRVFTHFNQIFFIILLIGFGSVMYARETQQNLLQSGIFWGCIGIIILFAILATICMADKYFEIHSYGKICQKIYLYNHGIYFPNNKIDMVVISMSSDEVFIFEQKITEDYDFWKNENFSSFLFCDGNLYYYLSPEFNELEVLGKRKTKTSFITENKPIVKFLDNSGILTIPAELFILNDVFIPPLAEQNIYSGEKKEKKPDKYIITKNSKKYSVYGLYEDRPACVSLQIPVVIFKEANQDVILIWDKQSGYQEFYRTTYSVKRQLSNVFVEITYRAVIAGTIKRFDEENKKFELLYKGRFYAIDFDNGAIIGENGFEYNP